MKRYFLIFLFSICVLLLNGCNRTKNVVNVNFKFETISKIVAVDMGTIITTDIIPCEENTNNIELYYDVDEFKTYNNEPIMNDIIIYVKFKEISEDQIKEDYLIYAKENGEKGLMIENVQILNHYGQYDDIVIVRMNRGAYQKITYVSFLDLKVQLKFGDSNTPLVYKNGKFYELKDAYNKGILTKEHVILLQEKISKD